MRPLGTDGGLSGEGDGNRRAALPAWTGLVYEAIGTMIDLRKAKSKKRSGQIGRQCSESRAVDAMEDATTRKSSGRGSGIRRDGWSSGGGNSKLMRDKAGEAAVARRERNNTTGGDGAAAQNKSSQFRWLSGMSRRSKARSKLEILMVETLA